MNSTSILCPVTPAKAGVHRVVARPSQEWLQCLRLRIARLVLASLTLLMPTGAIAQLGAARQACAADLKQLCPEVKPGEGRLKAADALAGLRVRWLDSEDGAQFANLNTPADYRAFRERLETATTR